MNGLLVSAVGAFIILNLVPLQYLLVGGLWGSVLFNCTYFKDIGNVLKTMALEVDW
jgi:hypothetical protein